MITQKLLEKFKARSGEKINCMDIINLNMQSNSGALKFILKGGLIGCFRIIASYSPEVFHEIDRSIVAGDIEAVAPPCDISAGDNLADLLSRAPEINHDRQHTLRIRM